ncbi:MAG: hypothetical protein ACI4RA_04690 [Kiritimatiellia bacterium]
MMTKMVMRMTMPACGLALALAAGCSPRTPTLEDEIAALPVEWTGFKTLGASSNNWAMLDRVMAVGDAGERVRLVKALYVHMRSTPEEILAKDRDNLYVFGEKTHFAGSCAGRLISDTNAYPSAAFEGWRLEALWLDDLERLIDLTEADWNGGKYDSFAPQRAKDAWGFAARVRRKYELYFRYSFGEYGTYKRLPEELRPAFVEQFRRDFFHRRGVSLADLSEFPPAFRE